MATVFAKKQSKDDKDLMELAALYADDQVEGILEGGIRATTDPNASPGGDPASMWGGGADAAAVAPETPAEDHPVVGLQVQLELPGGTQCGAKDFCLVGAGDYTEQPTSKGLFLRYVMRPTGSVVAVEGPEAAVPSDATIKAVVGLRDDSMHQLPGAPLAVSTHEVQHKRGKTGAGARIAVEAEWGDEVVWRKLGDLESGMVLQLQFVRMKEVDTAKARPLPNTRNLLLDFYRVGDAFLAVKADLADEVVAKWAETTAAATAVAEATMAAATGAEGGGAGKKGEGGEGGAAGAKPKMLVEMMPDSDDEIGETKCEGKE
jgi:hypothetical protein